LCLVRKNAGNPECTASLILLCVISPRIDDPGDYRPAAFKILGVSLSFTQETVVHFDEQRIKRKAVPQFPA
jgi:hypothetical protein